MVRKRAGRLDHVDRSGCGLQAGVGEPVIDSQRREGKIGGEPLTGAGRIPDVDKSRIHPVGRVDLVRAGVEVTRCDLRDRIARGPCFQHAHRLISRLRVVGTPVVVLEMGRKRLQHRAVHVQSGAQPDAGGLPAVGEGEVAGLAVDNVEHGEQSDALIVRRGARGAGPGTQSAVRGQYTVPGLAGLLL